MERKYYIVDGGTCQFAERCINVNNVCDGCYTCMYNTGGITTGNFSPRSEEDELTNEEADMIES